ncbi:MAG: 23S rRNA (pseudouridine(1915)-N(3))-methyltransferase RlmH [Parcubacteria group bacterium]
MLKITILAVGKVKDKNFNESFLNYLKRLSPYANVKVEEIMPEPFFDNSNKYKIKQKEGEKIVDYLRRFPQSKILILDENGKELKSEEFSNFLFENELENIIFVIGGALGFSEDILSYKSAIKISLSQLTFPHELVRVILVEQLYRAIAINKNKRYHY